MYQPREFAPPDAYEIGAAMPQTTILVIEDEPLIRMAVADDLRDAGFCVLEAANAEDALGVLSTESPIRAIFTDIELHGKFDGLELARMVKGQWPLIEIIITSGNRKNALSEMPERSLFFPKPYAHQAIIEALKQLTG